MAKSKCEGCGIELEIRYKCHSGFCQKCWREKYRKDNYNSKPSNDKQDLSSIGRGVVIGASLQQLCGDKLIRISNDILSGKRLIIKS